MQRDADFLKELSRRHHHKRKIKRKSNKSIFPNTDFIYNRTELINYFKEWPTMKIEDIKHELKGYFIYKNNNEYTLGLKEDKDFKLITDEIEYRTLTDKYLITPIRYLIMQINNQLLDPLTYVNDLSEVLPVIDFSIFTAYDNRNKEIEKHKQLLNTIKESKSIFGRKKDFKLIYIKKHNFLDNNKEQIGYYVIKDNKAVPIDAELLENKSDAVEVTNLSDLQNALTDDLENGYLEKYKEECSKWDSLN